ncbi:nitric oxide-associated protein 1 [Phymastichus coffea]|uniref:nitric oxide-associated protein 1 n=1 Tax=Phymastichus coffea TaxID=108790 RepID=UPI00273B8756|nr:nitric oxide-associated protein 1 [Phymastichus coffea]XP_058794563.1 nitric oxide-associated protein 1 [Phymastichus coffea]XP_058794571.1 nitric oxide-associated protein 1 [Phymastichus coffea]
MQLNILKLYKFKRAQKIYLYTSLKYHNQEVYNKLISKSTTDFNDIIDPKVKNIKDKLLYSDYLENNQLKYGYKQNIRIKNKLRYKFDKEKQELDRSSFTLSIALKYLDNESSNLFIKSQIKEINDHKTDTEELDKEKPIYMPYAQTDKFEKKIINTSKNIDENELHLLDEKFKKLYEKYLEITSYSPQNPTAASIKEFKLRLGDDCSKIPSSWMTDYEVYNDERQQNIVNDEEVKYGTPDPNIAVSSIPCGGCGALLHCQDPAIPGYLPSELFTDICDIDLKSIICQRCHFMKNYDTCLDVRVSPKEYPKLLEQINDNPKALVILLVDLTDFPCSIWPELPSLIGPKRNVIVIGNKIDLLPVDGPEFKNHVKDCLTESLIQMGIVKSKIKHIGLVSAKTGFGIEEVINKLHATWNYKSDIYLVGCTNTGKSTLFNHLLQSDLCKSQAVDLVQRATTSQWPGTTLNLLKFPILRPTPWRLYVRVKRLQEDRKLKVEEDRDQLRQYRKTRNIELTTLQSRITHSFKKDYEIKQAITKSPNQNFIELREIKKFGLDETANEYKYSKWFYDTPGTIQPDQILHLLTTDELLKTLPKKVISPRTFCIWPGQSIFIAGLGRLDILDVPTFIRCTVFANLVLPITICRVENADFIYRRLLESEAFIVPVNNPNRLKMWPELKSKDMETVGIGDKESVSDVVLSSAGWIAITAKSDEKVTMRGWTPEGRGIYLRTPALLPYSVNLRGMRRINSPAYRLGRRVYTSNRY